MPKAISLFSNRCASAASHACASSTQAGPVSTSLIPGTVQVNQYRPHEFLAILGAALMNAVPVGRELTANIEEEGRGVVIHGGEQLR